MGYIWYMWLDIVKTKGERNMIKELKPNEIIEVNPTTQVPVDLLARYEKLKNLVTERKDAFERLMDFVENETVYLTTPASTRFHLCTTNGLLEHSINVAETLLHMKSFLAPELSDESCVIVALMHDLGKAGFPGVPQYLERENAEREKLDPKNFWPPYKYNSDILHMGVPIRSLYLIGPRFPLTPTEAQAIVYHDGQYVKENRGIATREEPLSLLLQYADNWSGF
jgi:hypothetical protein